MTKAMEFVKEWNKRSAENGFEKILEEKFNDGEARGKAEGILETARNMLRNCFSVEDVVKATNLSKNKVIRIQKEIES